MAPPPPSQGNEFIFYVPAPRGTGTGTSSLPGAASVPAPKAKTVPTLTKPPGGGKAKYPSPAKFIQSNFVVTADANFGAMLPLGGTHHVVRKVDVIRAALEGGYGRKITWTTNLVLNPSEADALAGYLIQRLRMVDTFIEVDGNDAKFILPFFKRVESSEKTAISFILGGMGAYLAAQRWLEAGGDRIRSFLHVGTFTKGIAGKSAMVAFNAAAKKAGKNATNKVPDFLVEGESGRWHVFESKGGRFRGRWERVCEGLAQLAHVPKIAWAHKTPANVESCVCVHTSVDPGKAICIAAVDPPPIRRRQVKGKGKEEQSLELIEGVCRLLKVLETVEQFRALAVVSDDVEVSEFGWRFADSHAFGDLRVGVPDRYLEREDEVRHRLAMFFAIRDVLDEFGPSIAMDDFPNLVQSRLWLTTSSGESLQAWSFHPQDILGRLKPSVGSERFLLRCSKELGLEALATELVPPIGQDLDRTIAKLAQDGEFAITSGGLLLQMRAMDVPSHD